MLVTVPVYYIYSCTKVPSFHSKYYTYNRLYAKKKSSGPAKVTPKKITPAENSKHQLVKVKEAYD